MVKIKHPASTLAYEVLKNYMNSKTNQILIHLQTNTGADISLKINRFAFTKGCCSKPLADASADRTQDTADFMMPDELHNVIQSREFSGIFQSWAMYLATGELDFEMENFGLIFSLACSFEVHQFFQSLVKQKIKIPMQRQNKKLIMRCCFDTYADFFAQFQGDNFIHCMFKNHNLDWLSEATSLFDDLQPLQSFINEYIHYKGQNGQLKDNDISQILDIYKRNGMTPDKAKTKVKSLVKWEDSPIEILQNNRKLLKFQEPEIRLILQKRLNRLMRTQNQEQVDDELIELRQTRDKLKEKYDNLVAKQGQHKLQLELTKAGSYRQNSSPQQKPSSIKKISIVNNNQWEQDRNFYQYKQEESYIRPSSYAEYPDFEKKEGREQQQQLHREIDRVLKDGPPRQKGQSNGQQPSPQIQESRGMKMDKNIHAEDNQSCGCKKSFTTQCRCELCCDCFKTRYVQKTQIWDYLEMNILPLKPGDFKKYGIRCYKCDAQMNDQDVGAYLAA